MSVVAKLWEYFYRVQTHRISKLVIENKQLQVENSDLRADKARLDWLDEKGCWLTITGQKNFISGSARAVIDAAMGEGKQ